MAQTPDTDLDALLAQSAGATLDALRQPIADMQSPWYAFWELGELAGRFGRYGEAGNRFGRAAVFPCGTDRCQLLDDDPIYATFAAAQHRLALLATMRGILLLQRSRRRAMRRGGDLPQGLRRRAWARLALQGLAPFSLGACVALLRLDVVSENQGSRISPSGAPFHR